MSKVSSLDGVMRALRGHTHHVAYLGREEWLLIFWCYLLSYRGKRPIDYPAQGSPYNIDDVVGRFVGLFGIPFAVHGLLMFFFFLRRCRG